MLPYPSLSGFERRKLEVSAAPKIWSVSRRAERDIWKLGRSGESASWSSGSSSLGSGTGRAQEKVVKRALSRKTMPKECQ